MKIKAIALALLAFALPASAQRITMTVTVTNRAVTSNSFTANGSVRVFTNVTGALTIATNLSSINATKTNLFNQIASFPFTGITLADGTGSADTGTNAFRLFSSFGGALSGSITGAWGYVTLSTQSGPSTFPYLYPVANVVGETNRTNQASDVVLALNSYPTNFAATNASWLSNYVTKGAHSNQVVTSPVRFTGDLSADKELRATNGFTSSLTNINSVSSNHINFGNALRSEGSGGNSLQLGSNAMANGLRAVTVGNNSLSASADSVTFGNSSSNGGTSGTVVGTLSTNAGASESTIVGYRIYNTGSSSAGLGSTFSMTNGEQVSVGYAPINRGLGAISIGSGPTAASDFDIAHGFECIASNLYAMALGALASAQHSNSAAIGPPDHGGTATTTTTTNEIVLGTANHHVRIPGFLRTVVGASNFLTTASSTNVLRGSFSYPRFDLTTLANGNNIAIPLGTNRFVRLSGTVTASPTLCGFIGAATSGGNDGQDVIIHNDLGYAATFAQNTVDPVPANRVETADGNDVTLANNGWLLLEYSGADSRWHVADVYPVTASATNALYSLQTNGVSVTTAWTNLNLIYGTGMVVRATNTAGSVDVLLSAAVNTNGYISLFINNAKPALTNQPSFEGNYYADELLFPRTNAAGTDIALSANWSFAVPTDYATNTATLRIIHSITATNGPNVSNVVWRASFLHSESGSTTDLRVGAFGTAYLVTNEWAACYNCTNQAAISTIAFTNASALSPGGLGILKLERVSTVDTYVGAASLIGLQIDYGK